MIKGSEVRKADHPIAQIFLDRWSPRAMSGAEVSMDVLLTLFEAARWAPSSYNNQPWRLLYARRGDEHWELFFNLLHQSNQKWASQAGALVLFISKTTFDHKGAFSPTHSLDTGSAWENLALQGALLNLVVHGMQGFEIEKAREYLHIPQEYHIEMMAAIGHPGSAETLPDELRQRESPNHRRPLDQTVCAGPFDKLSGNSLL